MLLISGSEITGFIQWIQNKIGLACEEQGSHWPCDSASPFLDKKWRYGLEHCSVQHK